jgi:hypothetical protein
MQDFVLKAGQGVRTGHDEKKRSVDISDMD